MALTPKDGVLELPATKKEKKVLQRVVKYGNMNPRIIISSLKELLVCQYTKAVQRLLIQYSTSTRTKIVNAGGVDGSFGKGTTNALKDFQASQDLSSDGSCGPATWGGLCALLDIPNHPNGYFYYRTFAGCSYTYYAIRQGDSTGNWAVQTGTDVATTTSAGSYTTFKTY